MDQKHNIKDLRHNSDKKREQVVEEDVSATVTVTIQRESSSSIGNIDIETSSLEDEDKILNNDDEEKKEGQGSEGGGSKAQASGSACELLETIDEDDDWDTFSGQNDMMQTFDDRAAKVRPHMFIGGFLVEQNKNELKRHSITHILQVM